MYVHVSLTVDGSIAQENSTFLAGVIQSTPGSKKRKKEADYKYSTPQK